METKLDGIGFWCSSSPCQLSVEYQFYLEEVSTGVKYLTSSSQTLFLTVDPNDPTNPGFITQTDIIDPITGFYDPNFPYPQIPLIPNNQYKVWIEIFNIYGANDLNTLNYTFVCYNGTTYPPTPFQCDLNNTFTYTPEEADFTFQQQYQWVYRNNTWQYLPTLDVDFSDFSNSSSNATYDWASNNVSFSSQADPIYTFPNCGIYEVELELTNSISGCTSSLIKTVDLSNATVFCTEENSGSGGSNGGARQGATLATNLSHDLAMKVYPNPSSGQMPQILLHSNSNEIIQVKVSDLTGKEIFRKNNKAKLDQSYHTLQFPEFEKGVYILQLQQGTQSVSEIVLIQ